MNMILWVIDYYDKLGDPDCCGQSHSPYYDNKEAAEAHLEWLKAHPLAVDECLEYDLHPVNIEPLSEFVPPMSEEEYQKRAVFEYGYDRIEEEHIFEEACAKKHKEVEPDRTDSIDSIELKEYANGICAFFYLHGKQYCADLTYMNPSINPRYFAECMIFRSEDDQVTDWTDLYSAHNIPVSREGLLQCIKEFMDNNM